MSTVINIMIDLLIMLSFLILGKLAKFKQKEFHLGKDRPLSHNRENKGGCTRGASSLMISHKTDTDDSRDVLRTNLVTPSSFIVIDWGKQVIFQHWTEETPANSWKYYYGIPIPYCTDFYCFHTFKIFSADCY